MKVSIPACAEDVGEEPVNASGAECTEIVPEAQPGGLCMGPTTRTCLVIVTELLLSS